MDSFKPSLYICGGRSGDTPATKKEVKEGERCAHSVWKFTVIFVKCIYTCILWYIYVYICTMAQKKNHPKTLSFVIDYQRGLICIYVTNMHINNHSSTQSVSMSSSVSTMTLHQTGTQIIRPRLPTPESSRNMSGSICIMGVICIDVKMEAASSMSWTSAQQTRELKEIDKLLSRHIRRV